ncbi:hypothetical protein AJ80_08471 [Polytolypa hystricis UAMH7299]|uniref:DNA repair protein RAD16 n=1 Tax=Polytolypa hystricis (strain UAMH7299) TaxID=1447883 RepID=A0A2B7X7J7_POLH7|nr:hypothetical protein AJ80_08471 [Polytolypa hystricis UAMH7299]
MVRTRRNTPHKGGENLAHKLGKRETESEALLSRSDSTRRTRSSLSSVTNRTDATTSAQSLRTRPLGTDQPSLVVSVPIKNPTSYSSYSPLSSDTSGQGTSQRDTPATTANVTPAESDTMDTLPRRISASTRALELRASAFAMRNTTNNLKRTARLLSADDSVAEGSDASLARDLQAEEYGDASVKRLKTSSGIHQANYEVGNSTEDSDDVLSDPLSVDSCVPAGFRLDWSDEDNYSAVEPFALDGEDTDDDSSEDGNSETIPPPGRRVLPSYRRRRTLQPRLQALTEEEMRLTPRALRERRKLEKQHPLVKTMWGVLRDTPVINPTPASQPSAITRKLKPFQLEGLNWMIQQEKSQWKGGLLGDEMGMGKTIQAVSLLMSDYPVGMPSLVVVPPVALMQWQSEIQQYTDGKLKVLIYHNSNPKVKHLTSKDLKSYDVIMISYSGLESMHRKELKGWNRNDGIVKEESIIHSLHFHRLILDEAHNIKQRSTSVAKACFALKANYKWCLSGTPVQNRIGEFFSLLRFLEVKPFACYFCKVCKCQQLHWSQDAEKRCTSCRHSGFSHVSIFNQEILNPISERGSNNLRQDALKKLRLITDRIMLRRVKKDHTAAMELPPKRIILHNEFFGEIERDFSSSIMTNSTRQFDTYVSRGVMLNNYANIFGLIMQMRQVANHPDLILKKHAEGGQNILVCSICDEPAEEAIRSRCRHEFCRQCAKDYIRSFESKGEPDCPRCHISLSIDFEQPDIEQQEEQVKKNSIINRIKMENWTSSTKIEMLVYDLYKLRSKKQTHKSIVFSQFTSMLQLVEWRLRRAGFNTVMLDGSMTPAQRQKSIEYFMNNVDVEVFLVSLKAGGVALNLTEASRVFIIDPWWNPAAEWQSADRCHRIGQRRPCVITRLCIEDSVESRMVLLQEKKANMIRATINKDQGEALEKLTPEDMQFLFRGT